MLTAALRLQVGGDDRAGVGRIVGQFRGSIVRAVGHLEVDVFAADMAERIHTHQCKRRAEHRKVPNVVVIGRLTPLPLAVSEVSMSRLTMLLLLLSTRAFAADYDVCVYGGTPAGVAAAIQVARMGKSVVLIEPSKHIGGMTSGGLGFTDSGDKSAIGGIAREFYQRVKKHYDDPKAWKYGKREDYKAYRPKEDAMWTFEPHVAEEILREMLKEAEVEVVTMDAAVRRRFRDG